MSEAFDLKHIATVVAAVAGILGSWWTIEGHISSIVKEQTIVIAKIYADDLRLRIVVQQTEIDELKKLNLTIPSYLEMNLKLMQERMLEISKWH